MLTIKLIISEYNDPIVEIALTRMHTDYNGRRGFYRIDDVIRLCKENNKKFIKNVNN